MGKLVCIGGGEIPRIKNGIQLPYETKEIDEEMWDWQKRKILNYFLLGLLHQIAMIII